MIAYTLVTGILAVVGASVAQVVSVVDVGYAKYAGMLNTTSGNTPFLGIRFAASPTGTLRWQPPQPPAYTPGVQKASSQPPMCFQAARGVSPTSPFRTGNFSVPVDFRKRQTSSPFPSSEDCLFLNVWIPGTISQRVRSKPLPVLVWIHGGGYTLGAASGVTGTGRDIFSGDDLISEADGGVVSVVIQYRLGLFGFLAGNDVKEGGALNAGLLDQRFALEWIQRHIRKFGGDPTRVTIWGESAGAGSVLQHMISNGGTEDPLFRGGISSSMFIPSQYLYNDTVPEGLYSQVVERSGCTNSSDKLACLRLTSFSTLSSINVAINHAQLFATFAFVPVVDGMFIRDRPSVALRKGRFNGVQNVMAIYNAHEGIHFVDATTPPDTSLSHYITQLFPTMADKDTTKATEIYNSPSLGNIGILERMELVFGEAVLICPSYLFIRPFARRGLTGTFAIPPASHLDDVPFYFPSQNPSLFPNTPFTRAFSHSFLSFAKSLNPNIKSTSTITPPWKTWDNRHEMSFNKTEDGQPDVRMQTTNAALLERCRFWESVGDVIGL